MRSCGGGGLFKELQVAGLGAGLRANYRGDSAEGQEDNLKWILFIPNKPP